MHSTLSTLQKVGQRLMVGFDGSILNDQLRYYIDTVGVGGVMLFARNLIAPDQIQSLCAAIQTYAQQCGQPPLFIGIDQEGGQVARLKPPFTQFAGAAHMRTIQNGIDFARITAHELTAVGINMNMAPVLDVLPLQGPSVMQERSFGSDPQQVASFGRAIIKHLQQNSIIAVAKHFPGIGRTVLDSHHDPPDLELDWQSMAATDLLPFQSAIHQQVGGIMLSHIRYLQLDPDWPASLSKVVAADLLRKNMGYAGLVLTDDLDMGAIAKHYSVPQIVRQCLAAGVDILMICHPIAKIEAVAEEIKKYDAASEHIKALNIATLKRILSLKREYCGEWSGPS